MSSLFRHWYAHSGVIHALLSPLLRLREHLLLGHCLPPRTRINRDFQRTFGRPLPWDNPRTLNEKLNCMKHLVRSPLQRTCADKLAVRDHVAKLIGPDHLIPLLATFARARDVTPAAISSPSFILKVNHGSGQNIIVRDAATADFRTIRLRLADWMHTSHYTLSCEQPYRGIPPRILAEPLLLAPDGSLPLDYKLHCFAGRTEFIQVDIGRETDHRRNFYDRDWNLLPFLWCEWDGDRPLWPNGPAGPPPPPDLLREMLALAETLASPFPYVRVDLYLHQNKIYFGELTFYHGSGLERFSPPSQDLALGKLLPWP
jgi:hypothetical protein